MKEENFKKAIELKEQLDGKRELLQLTNSCYMNLRVNLEEEAESGRILNVNYLLGDNVIKELKAKIIANIKKRINDLQEEFEKL